MWLNLVFLMLLALVFLPASLVLYGMSRWQAATTVLRKGLEGAREQIVPSTYDSTDLVGLPPPVERYFRAILTEGQPIIAAAEVRAEGELSPGGPDGRWSRVTATQSVVTGRPGFLWDARARIAPVATLFVHDAYIAGEGLMRASLFGLFGVVEVPGGADLARAELMRFLAEAPWYPTKLLPSQGVAWEAIDDRSALATLADGERSVSLRFEFDEAGLIQAAYAQGRHRALQGALVETPWEVRFAEYREHGGMRIPVRGEAAWVGADGRVPYWHGRVTDILYKFAA